MGIYAFSIGRATLSDSQEFPAFAVSDVGKIWVEQAEGFPEQFVRQLSDGVVLLDVIKMTGLGLDESFARDQHLSRRLESGERLSLRIKGRKITGFDVRWMPAAKRISLGIQLHPDQMSQRDWESLPGIGNKLAARIESDRHINGDFGSLEGLKRVPGIGNKSIEKWRKYF